MATPSKASKSTTATQPAVKGEDSRQRRAKEGESIAGSPSFTAKLQDVIGRLKTRLP